MRSRSHADRLWYLLGAVGLLLSLGGCFSAVARPCRKDCEVTPSTGRCKLSLPERAAAWGKFVKCVECVAATKGYDPSSPPMHAALIKCQKTYFSTWNPSCGPRFVSGSNGKTIVDKLSGIEWEKKADASGRDYSFGANGCFCNVGSTDDEQECADPNFFANCYTLGSLSDELAPGTLQQEFIPGINNYDHNQGYAGFRDWRLPSFAELLTTLQPGNGQFVGANPDFKALDPTVDIPNQANPGKCPYYWAGTLVPYQTPSGGNLVWNGWYVRYDCNPTLGENGRDNFYRARAVRRGL